jgi:hypothetical protein
MLADGTRVSGGALLTGENRWPFFSGLYQGRGSISGWITLDRSQLNHDLSGTVDWKRPGGIASSVHADGFRGQSNLSGGINNKFVLLVALSRADTFSQLTLQSPANDPLPLNFSIPFPLHRVGRTAAAGPPDSGVQFITCKVQAKTGLLSGNLVERGVIRKIQGIVVGSKVNQAGGFVLRNGYSTALRITPANPQ